MPQTYQNPVFEYVKPPELRSAKPGRYPVVVVGAGPVGLAAAIDLAQHGETPIVLDEDNTVSVGSRAICFSKRTLEILDRLGCGQPVVDKGITWNVGKVFFRDEMVYQFNLLPEEGHHRPAFVNLQQYYFEEYLLDRWRALSDEDVRWKNRVAAILPGPDAVELEVETPDGRYRLTCDYVVVADGAHGSIRHMMGLESKGQVFKDRFLIADVLMKADFPTERWFWFDPPFHRGQSTLLHRQADDVWRIDFQLGWDADPELEKRPERVIPRIKAMLGQDAEFELEWVSVYTFQCRRMDRFRYGRVFFTGDAAHQVSPFGARGANSGIQDTDNLIWKLKLVIDGTAPDALLDTYDAERIPAAEENIANSTRSTDFITPKSDASRAFRDATLLLAKQCAFARRLVNSGRLSVPAVLRESPLNTPDADPFHGPMVPGAPCVDAPAGVDGDDWFLNHVGGDFRGLYFPGADGGVPPQTMAMLRSLATSTPAVKTLVVGRPPANEEGVAGIDWIDDPSGLLTQRYDGRPGTFYLIRPDQHVAARWRRADAQSIRAALRTATGQTDSERNREALP